METKSAKMNIPQEQVNGKNIQKCSDWFNPHLFLVKTLRTNVAVSKKVNLIYILLKVCTLI